jgi:Family of unknown function (DUF5961)
MPQILDPRRFSVYARHVESHHARIIQEASFEAAAVAYVEHYSLPAGTDLYELSVVVREIGTGHEHCFKIDLDSGETAPCG